ncbi:HNH endonuclease [Verrucomicrobia bacterium]|nr:HNH endonuclease [Verrucomicrobiota bacterium]
MTSLINSQVLVLNRLWQAVNICSAKRALTLLFQGQAQVVFGDQDGVFQTFNFPEWSDFSSDNPGDRSIASVSLRLRIPQVILLIGYDRFPKKEVKFTRHNLFTRDKNTCQYCDKGFDRQDLNLDHVIPRDRGGPTNWENIVCSCIKCNTIKRNRTPREAGMKLRRKPCKPKWRPFIQFNFGTAERDEWKHFIDVEYWNVELGEET